MSFPRSYDSKQRDRKLRTDKELLQATKAFASDDTNSQLVVFTIHNYAVLTLPGDMFQFHRLGCAVSGQPLSAHSSSCGCSLSTRFPASCHFGPFPIGGIDHVRVRPSCSQSDKRLEPVTQSSPQTQFARNQRTRRSFLSMMTCDQYVAATRLERLSYSQPVIRLRSCWDI